MLAAVFISDLHLHPTDEKLLLRFQAFLRWAALNTRTLYILGDFFHVWVGDDNITPWGLAIAQKLANVASLGVKIYFMPGNRDFLLGSKFLSLANMQLLADPTLITLNKKRVLLTHGDALCTDDTAHMWLRFITRNRIFTAIFLQLPLSLRKFCVQTVRKRSEKYGTISSKSDVVAASLKSMMQTYKVTTLIHGHTHKPGIVIHDAGKYTQYVLSDWDDLPDILCYDDAQGVYFYRFTEEK